MQFNSFKTGGVIYKITDTELVGHKKSPKRELWVEVPTQSGMSENTTIFLFEVMFEETNSLDFFKEGEWVDIVKKERHRVWTPPRKQDENGESFQPRDKLFNSKQILDVRKAPNPFEEGKDLRNTPDDLSNTIVSELGDQVKDWVNEKPKQDTLFDPPSGDDDQLPF
jgi:hypothetical protein